MSDLISRQAAIDAIDVLCQEHRYRIPGKSETYSQYNEAWQDALDRAEGAIGNLPSSQSEPHWIPCSERLPDQNGKYLVVGRQKAINILKFDGGRWYGKWGVVAWMPLPEPYREEDRINVS